jgi:Protein of unknown function (DUF3237)
VSDTLGTRLLLTIELGVGAPLAIGDVGAGIRRCIPLLSGRFSGDLEGEVIAGGADWQTVLADGTLEIAAHYVLRTREGATIEVISTGVRSAPAAVLDRLARAEPVAAHEYYFRTHIRFRTAAPQLDHLNKMLALSHGERFPDRVRLRVFEVL